MIRAVNGTLEAQILNKLQEPIIALQYGDDTALLASADLTTMISLKLTLWIFASVSGLYINYGKSSFLPLNLSNEQQKVIQLVFGCEQESLPISYLGMPLTIKRLTIGDFMLFIERIEKMMQ